MKRYWLIGFLAGALLAFTGATLAQQEMLNNPSFELGSSNWNGRADLQVPNGWSLIWAENDSWFTPSTRVWARGTNGKGLWRDGNYNYAVFSNGAPFWAQLNQTISGLDPSRVYNLSVPVFPEMVAAYVSGNGKLYNTSERAVEVRLYVRSAGQDAYDTGYINAISLPVGRWSRLSLNFAPLGPDAEISIEVRTPHPGQYNAVYLDGLSLKVTSLYSPAYQQQQQARAAAEKDAQALVKQAEKDLQTARFSDPSTYTVVSGDSWARIASKHGTTAPELARLNGTRDNTSLRVGQVIAVPGNVNSSVLVAAATERVNQARAYADALARGENPPKPVFADLPTVSPLDVSSTAAAIDAAAQQRQALAAAEADAQALLRQAERDLAQARFNNPVPYVIVGGDSLSRIATRLNTTAGDIARLNGFPESTGLRVGQVIKVPSDTSNSLVVAAAAARVAQAQAYLDAVRAGQLLPKPDLPPLPPNVPYASPAPVMPAVTPTLATTAAAPVGGVTPAAGVTLLATDTPAAVVETPSAVVTSAPQGSGTYVVQPGDNLARIARRLGVSADDILRLNNISNPSLIQPGQQLIIP